MASKVNVTGFELDFEVDEVALREFTSQGIEFKTLLPVLIFSTFMFIVCMAWFGMSVQRGDMNRLFAPRSWARPKAVSQKMRNLRRKIIRQKNWSQNFEKSQQSHPIFRNSDCQKPNQQALRFVMDSMGSQAELFGNAGGR